MDDALAVGRCEATRDLSRILQGGLRADCASLQEITKGLTLEQFGNDKGRAVLGAKIVDADNIRMVQSREGARLLLKAVDAVGITDKTGGQNLDRDGAAEPGVECSEDLAHAACA